MKLAPAFLTLAMIASAANAEGETDYVQQSRSHDGGAFSVRIPDVECAVAQYLDIDVANVQNDGEGLIRGENGGARVMVQTVNPVHGSDWEELSWVQVSRGKQSASINHSSFQGAFISVTAPDQATVDNMAYSVQDFENFIRNTTCSGPAVPAA